MARNSYNPPARDVFPIAACEPLRDTFVDALRQLGEVRYSPRAWSEAESLVRAAAGARVLVTRNRTRVTRELLDRLPHLGCVAVYGAGKEHLDLDALQQRGLHLVRCSREVAGSIAEFTLGLTLALLRRIPEAMRQVRGGGWDHDALLGDDLAGRTVLVVGCGAIGQRTAALFHAVGCPVLVSRHRPLPLPVPLRQLGCRRVDLDTGLAAADVVSLHVAGGAGSRHLIAAREIELMPNHCLLINTSRGSVVDLPALVESLKRGRLGGAALDVLPEEPPARPPPDHPRLLVTPHLALYSRQAVQRRIETVVDGIRGWLRSAGPHPTPDQ